MISAEAASPLMSSLRRETAASFAMRELQLIEPQIRSILQTNCSIESFQNFVEAFFEIRLIE